MTAKELLQSQCDEAGFMLRQTVKGLSAEDADKQIAGMMSARQMLEHLCEAYVAAEKTVRGEKHEWGSYHAADPSWEGVQQAFEAARAKAVAACCTDEDDALKAGNAYIVAHDQYHVGQLAAIRLALDPSWDAYSIYGE